MTDSFFRRQTIYDTQAATWHEFTAIEVLESATRRLVTLKGPIGAYEELQQLADLCAARNLLPIEYWTDIAEEPEPAPAPPAKPRSALSTWLRQCFSRFHLPSYLIGFGLSYLLTVLF